MTTALENTTSQLSVELKTSTAAAHERAEHSTFMDELLGGRLGVADFIALQEQSWLFYTALENAARAVADDPIAADVVDAKLERVPALEADLDHLHGTTEWRNNVTALPATAEYVARLNEIAETKDAARLVAHHYVRYLGDLSGGQVIGRMMQRHYDVADDAVSFYRFAEIPKVKPYKDDYRAKLDALPLSDSDRERLLAEATDAFLYNLNLFNALGQARA
ncbi:heme oxygenase (biliverdin-producing) [Corynebacterium aquilae]|uniref:heme oxygenase (biliverdin-producing) n=1 Tax=Corynebacterium aquilae DSM 44791 TaxID=1431546 RepID=A0A1L7CH23_9CORY|nr:biliverdin-producing heme oxygenase [Corynebacterium aquilae]APT85147.1 heme oxygenase [Corynebacterium aquilae DSM 44791]